MHILTLLANRLSATCADGLTYAWMIGTVQLGLFALNRITSFLLCFEFSIPYEMHRALWSCAGVFIISRAPVFRLYRPDRGMGRYFRISDTIRVTSENAIASAIAATVISGARRPPFPRFVIIPAVLVSSLFSIGVIGSELLPTRGV
jgi:FlaA1/EpsC-like NDP-sugar epimerase